MNFLTEEHDKAILDYYNATLGSLIQAMEDAGRKKEAEGLKDEIEDLKKGLTVVE